MVPQFALISRMGLTDSHLGLILMQAFSGFGVFLIRQFMIGVPNELLEAARIDGLSEYGIFAKIALPLVKPGIATLVIFTFVNIWNDFMGPLIYLNEEKKYTLSLGLQLFQGSYGAQWHLLMAASVLVLTPAVIVFFFGQKHILEGIATTGIKG